MYNQNAGYWNLMATSLTPITTWKTFYVTSAIGTGKSAQILQDIFPIDTDWTQRVFSTIALALAATTAGRWDMIVIANDYTTAPTDAERTTAGTNWVQIVYASNSFADECVVTWASKALPATTTGDLFAITWLVEIVAVIWVVTTVVQTQACNLKLSTVSNSATTDICADLNISAAAAQDRLSITWTFANAMIKTAKGVPVARQATSIVAQEWTIIATTNATNTWAIRWSVLYRPLQAWSKVVAS